MCEEFRRVCNLRINRYIFVREQLNAIEGNGREYWTICLTDIRRKLRKLGIQREAQTAYRKYLLMQERLELGNDSKTSRRR